MRVELFFSRVHQTGPKNYSRISSQIQKGWRHIHCTVLYMQRQIQSKTWWGGGGVKCSSHKGQQMAPNIKISYAGNWSFPIIDDWIKWRNHESSVRALNLRVLLSKAVLTFLASFITLSAIVSSIFIICSIVGALVIQQRFVCPDHTHSAELNFRATTL